MTQIINFAKIRSSAVIPSKNKEDAGYDIYANFEESMITIPPLSTKLIPTGIASAFSDEYYFQIEERGSTGSIGMKKSAGVIDSSYRGEWFIPIFNSNNKTIIIDKSISDTVIDEDKIRYPYSKAICQAILLPVPDTIVKEIDFDKLKNIPSKRGSGALGSSGK